MTAQESDLRTEVPQAEDDQIVLDAMVEVIRRGSAMLMWRLSDQKTQANGIVCSDA